MKVCIRGYLNRGCGPSVEIELERGNTGESVRMRVLTEYEYDDLEIDAVDLWRALLALLSDPEKHGLRKPTFDF